MNMTLEVQRRDDNAKTNHLRKRGHIPGCIYGKTMKTVMIQIDKKQLQKMLDSRTHRLELKLDGKTYFVGLGEIQRTVVEKKLQHISFLALDKNEKATLKAVVRLTGKAKGTTEGGLIDHFIRHLSITGLPQDLPDMIAVDISDLNLGDSIHVSDLAEKYPFEFQAEDMDKVIARCQQAKELDLGTPATPAQPGLAEVPQESKEGEGETNPVEPKKEAA